MSNRPQIAPDYLDLRGLATFCGLSERTLRDCLNDGARPLPHYRVKGRGKVLVRVDEFHRWMVQWRTEGSAKARVDEILGDLQPPATGKTRRTVTSSEDKRL